MAINLASVASANSTGSLASVGSSLVNLGTSTKAFLATHPVSTGFIMGVTSVYILGRLLKKRRKKQAISALQTS